MRKWAQEPCVGCPKQRYIPGKQGKLQGRDRVGIVEGSCGYRARGISIRGKFVLSRNVGYKTRGVAMLLNVVVTPAGLPSSQTSGMGPSASCGYCCPLCPTGGRYPGKFRFIEPQEGNGHKSSDTPRESQANFRAGTVLGL